MGNSIKIDALASELATALSQYSENVNEEVKKAIDEETKAAVRDLKQSSPRLTGAYSKGWTSKAEYKGKYSNKNVIHNKTDYQLTHLLEYGHVGRNGKRVAAVPHIKAVEDRAVENLTRKVESAASGNS